MTPTKMTVAEAVERAQVWFRHYDIENLVGALGGFVAQDKEALSVLSSLAEEVEHRCDQRDAALESCALLSAEVTRLTDNIVSGTGIALECDPVRVTVTPHEKRPPDEK
jgi:hypothetical protein